MDEIKNVQNVENNASGNNSFPDGTKRSNGEYTTTATMSLTQQEAKINVR